jgi:hypothetical protein
MFLLGHFAHTSIEHHFLCRFLGEHVPEADGAASVDKLAVF